MREIKNYNQALLEVDFVINAPYPAVEAWDIMQKEKLFESDVILPARQSKAKQIPDYAYIETRKYGIAQKRNRKLEYRRALYAKKLAKQITTIA